MSEKFYSREEVIEALRLVTEGGSMREDGMVSASEVDQLAREMGVDGDRLREVLAGGTGTIESREVVSKGWGWPGNEEFERIVSGELTATDLADVADIAGGRYEVESMPGVREDREFWEGFRYVTVDVGSRDGRTKVMARSKTSFMRLTPVFFGLFLFMFIFFAATLKTDPTVGDPTNLNRALEGVLSIGILSYLGIGWGMRISRKRILERVDRIAESVQERVRRGSRSYTNPLSTELSNSEEHQSAILGEDGG